MICIASISIHYNNGNNRNKKKKNLQRKKNVIPSFETPQLQTLYIANVYYVSYNDRRIEIEKDISTVIICNIYIANIN